MRKSASIIIVIVILIIISIWYGIFKKAAVAPGPETKEGPIKICGASQLAGERIVFGAPLQWFERYTPQ